MKPTSIVCASALFGLLLWCVAHRYEFRTSSDGIIYRCDPWTGTVVCSQYGSEWIRISAAK
jgi:hypothetical protein